MAAALTGGALIPQGAAPAQTPASGQSAPIQPNPVQPTIVQVEYVQLPLNLPAGATIRQTLTRTTQQTVNGKMVSASFEATFLNRLKPHADGFSVTKTRVKGAFRMDGDPGAAEREGIERLMQAAGALNEVRYVADINLSPLRIEQWPQFRNRLKSAMRKSGALQAREADAFDALYMPMSAEIAAEQFLAEDALLSIPHNLGLSLNNPYRLDSMVDGPLGGTLSAHETLTLTRWDPAAGIAEVTYESGPSDATLAAYAQARTKDKGAVSLKLGTTCRYRVDLKTGLVPRADCKSVRNVSIGDDHRLRSETWVLQETLEP
ncbi:MAG: hypothetical protein QM667_05420 [Asticcacaulis sp.]